MKKLSLSLSLLLIGSVLFAMGWGDTSVGGSYTLLAEKGGTIHPDIFAAYNAAGIHISEGKKINDDWSYRIDAGVYFPFAMAAYDDGNKLNTDTSDFKSLMGYQITLGFPYTLKSDDRLTLGAGPAFDFVMHLGTVKDGAASGLAMFGGIGAILDAKYRFNESSFFNYGIMGFYNLWHNSVYISQASDTSGFTSGLFLKPYVGIGISINPKK